GLVSQAAMAQGFESARTLPKGARNLTVRTVDSDISLKTDSNGRGEPLAAPLAQNLTFGKIAAGEGGLKATQMKSFLAEYNFSEDQVVGSFTADLKGRVSVTAPIFAYGVTDRLTVGFAVPYYR